MQKKKERARKVKGRKGKEVEGDEGEEEEESAGIHCSYPLPVTP